jgi:ribosomal-protein-alanine acetyltransferase
MNSPAEPSGGVNTPAAPLIRRMRAGDLDRVMAIAASLAHAPQWPPSAYMAALRRQATPRRIALVAEDPIAGVVAFAVASLIAPQAELETIAVEQSAQRRGIARKLLSALADELTASAAAEFLLEVRAGNHAALALYRSLEWRETGRRPRYYSNPQEDAVLMSLPLG